MENSKLEEFNHIEESERYCLKDREFNMNKKARELQGMAKVRLQLFAWKTIQSIYILKA